MDTVMQRKVLVLGNTLLQDEGLGVRAVEALLARADWGPDVELLDGGTLGLDLLPRLVGVTHLLVLDSILSPSAPEGVVRLEGDAIPAALATKASMHQVGLQDLLAVASLQGNLPARRVLLGLQPQCLDWGTELSPEVAATLPALVQAAEALLERWLA
jgi:hydrogenase maturation protease